MASGWGASGARGFAWCFLQCCTREVVSDPSFVAVERHVAAMAANVARPTHLRSPERAMAVSMPMQSRRQYSECRVGFKQSSREKGSGREEEEGSSCSGGSASYPSVEACLTCRLKRGTGAVISYTALPQSHPDDQNGGWRGQEQ